MEKDPLNQCDSLTDVAKKLYIDSCKRHVFLCVGDVCCNSEVGNAAWEALKSGLKERNLSLSDHEAACFRTKVGCLRVCQQGPIMVVYPDGHWYSGMTADRIPKFIEKQILRGEAISEWIFATNDLEQ